MVQHPTKCRNFALDRRYLHKLNFGELVENSVSDLKPVSMRSINLLLGPQNRYFKIAQRNEGMKRRFNLDTEAEFR
jgi:hypothetical protein